MDSTGPRFPSLTLDLPEENPLVNDLESTLPPEDTVGNLPTAERSVGWPPLAVALSLLVLLVTARCLRPSPNGLGTHQQLGLPPCTATVIWGIRCPGCGMTTSWAYFTRGQFAQSARTNVGGFLLALQSTITIPWLLVYGLRKASLPLLWWQCTVVALVITVVVTIIDWIIRLLAI